MWRYTISSFFVRSSLALNYLKRRPPSNPLCASYSSQPLEVAPLKSRSVVRISGVESHSFLQGLITNDINHFESKDSFFSLFLNHQGRVLFDVLLHTPNPQDKDTILVECDASFKTKLVSHLKLYKLKRKVEIGVDDKLSVWVVYDTATSITKKIEVLPFAVNKAYTFADPRLPELGWRVFSSIINPSDVFPSEVQVQDNENKYRLLRYSLGVGEGVKEIPFANAFPLEVNGDFLHGINFHKGCYLGQELTARTHHTGVVRKRLMPFKLDDANFQFQGDVQSLQILNEKDRPIGKVRGLDGNIGIALFRVEEAIAAATLKLNEVTLSLVSKPQWWPVEAPK